MNTRPKTVMVTGSFDDLRSGHIRFLQQAARLGELHVALWSADAIRMLSPREPKFPEAERRYLIEAIRYVKRVIPVTAATDGFVVPPRKDLPADLWAVPEADASAAQAEFCRTHGLEYRVITAAEQTGFPHLELGSEADSPDRKRVVVTGCFDWFHSGHVRFFEEVSELSDLYVVVGHDANIRLLKGEGHPLFPQDERRYMAQSIRYVKQALVSTGTGWMDAEPEIERIRPHCYAVNEDGDRPEKREFCRQHGIEYVVLKRTPKAGLTRRQSTALRGF